MKLACLIVLAGCQAALDQRLDVVDDTRVLAIVSEPPEVLPGNPVAVTALVGGSNGPVIEMPTWSLCDAPKPPTVDDAVATGPVLDHHRLAPARREPLGNQPCRNVGTAAGPERHDEAHVALRPSFRPGRDGTGDDHQRS